MHDGWQEHTDGLLKVYKQRELLRYLRPVSATINAVQVKLPSSVYKTWLQELGVPGHQEVQNQPIPLKLFSLNDYMGLSTHPQVCHAAAMAAATAGMGPRSSALVGGYTIDHQDLEQQLATLKGTEESLLFPSGFAANQAAMAVLGAGPGCEIFSDELNHASIIDGTRLAKLSGATVKVFRHKDLHHLEQLLIHSSSSKRRMVVTDSLFSMDDLQGLAALKRQYGFLLAIDEAHATLVCGKGGGGAAEAAGVPDQVDVHVGTLSKAVGSQGGFVACSRSTKSLLLNRGRPYVYSTALPLPTVAAASAAIRVSQTAESPIIPLIIGSEKAALSAAGRLLRQGIHVPAIRPPTVPPMTSRLRVSLSAAHTTADIDNLIEALGGSTFRTHSPYPIAKL